MLSFTLPCHSLECLAGKTLLYFEKLSITIKIIMLQLRVCNFQKTMYHLCFFKYVFNIY